MIENLLVRSPENALVEGASNLIDLLLKEACKREKIRIKGNPSIYWMSEELRKRKIGGKWIFHKRFQSRIDGLRDDRNQMVHNAKVDVHVGDVELNLSITLSILRWFYERYYNLVFPDSLHFVESQQEDKPVLVPHTNR